MDALGGALTLALDPDEILRRARAAFFAQPPPAYVAYTVRREERIDGLLDFEDTYVKRVWYREADHAGLTRRVVRGVARGPLVFERVVFDAAVDPGPPTADVFEPAPPPPGRRGSADATNDAARLRDIAVVRVTGELEYRATFADAEGGRVHLHLEPRRDPDRNRLRDLWVDAETFALRRAIAEDRLYDGFGVRYVPVQFDLRFDEQDGRALIRAIGMTTAGGGRYEATGPRVEGTYWFENVAFPSDLPAWYFEPGVYRAHIDEAPS